jgi:hypothetical protein
MTVILQRVGMAAHYTGVLLRVTVLHYETNRHIVEDERGPVQPVSRAA